MATTLTKSVSTAGSGYSGSYTYRCIVTENSYSIANNTSNVTIAFSIKGPWAPSFYDWSTSFGIIVDGSVKKTGSSTPYISTSYVQLLTWTGNVSHNSDGSKQISVSVYLKNGSSGYLPKQYTSSSPLSMGSVTLTTIPRASSITSASNVTLGNACSIGWTPASSSFKYKINFSLGSWSYTTDFISPNTTSAYTYTGKTLSGTETQNSTTIYKQLPSSVNGIMTATLTTYNSSGTQIGSASSKTFNVIIPSSVVPTVGIITLNPVNVNGNNILIQGKNKLTISVSGSVAGNGSSIKSYTFSGSGILSTTTTSSAVSCGPFSSSGTFSYTVTVTDNRGRSASKTKTITCYAYSTPYFKSFNAFKSNSSGTADDNGTYIKCSYSLAYSSVNSTNDVTVKIFYKKGSADYSSVTSLTDSTSTSGSQLLSSIAADSTYTVYATITDNYSGSSKSTAITIFGATRIMNVLPSGKGIAFGKMAEKEECIDSKYPIWSRGNVVTKNNNAGYYVTDASGNEEPAIYKNSENLWIGATQTDGTHISGSTLISAGTDTNGVYVSKLISNARKNCLIIDTGNYLNYVVHRPFTLFSSSTGTIGTITFSSSYSAASFAYLEIFYADNNSKEQNSIKVYSPDGKYVSLSCIEPSTTGSEPRVYIRTSGWTISGTSMTPGRSNGENAGVYAQIYPHANGTNIDAKVIEANYIKIFRIVGYVV